MRRGRVKERERKIGMNLWGGVREREDDWIYEYIEEEREIWGDVSQQREKIWRNMKVI